MRRSDDEELQFKTNKETDLFQERLVRALSVESLASLGKALGLSGETERTFVGARILTDVRPIFDDGSSPRVEGFVVINTLKIDFHEGREHGEVYIALDSADLESLRKRVERAQAKTASLSETMSALKLRQYKDPQLK